MGDWEYVALYGGASVQAVNLAAYVGRHELTVEALTKASEKQRSGLRSSVALRSAATAQDVLNGERSQSKNAGR